MYPMHDDRARRTVDLDALDLGHLATFVAHAYDQRVQAALDEAGLTGLRHAHGYVFQHLLSVEPTLGELADRMEVTQQAASKVVTELADLGYLERVVDPDDARVRRIRLTARGRLAVERSRQTRAALERELTEVIGSLDAARSTLVAALRALGAEARIRARR
jgi:DNA-binding MarR family transcriptional regulator